MDSQNPNQNLYIKPGSRFSHFRKRKQSETVKIVGNYRIGGKLGEGSNGFVYSAYRLDGEKRAAVKILPRTEQTYDKLKNEIDIISSISHTNVVQVYQIVEQQNKIFIFMEICSKGDLFYYIQRNKKLEEAQSAQILIKIHQVLTYLHNQGITHRDIKAQNILLDQDFNPKLTDFGLARRYNHKENALLQTWCGSFNYVAPEIIKKRKYKPELVDLWSLAVLLYIMLIGKEPFNRFEDRSATKQAIISYDWFKDPKLSKQANQFFQAVFVPPQHRINLAQVTNTSFYRKYNKNINSNENQTTISKSSAQLPNPTKRLRTNSNPHEKICNTLTQHLQKPLNIEYGNKSELLGQMIPRNRIELLHMLKDQREMKNKSHNQTHMDRFRIRRSLPKKNQYLYDF